MEQPHGLIYDLLYNNSYFGKEVSRKDIDLV